MDKRIEVFELFNKKETIYFWEFFIDIKTNKLKITIHLNF